MTGENVWGKIKVIVVDDHVFVRKTIAGQLQELGVKYVREADDGGTVLEMLEKELPDLLISDVDMKPMNGLELLKQIRCGHKQVARDLPVFLVAEHVAWPLIEVAAELDADGFFRKPLAQDLLIRHLTGVLQHRQGIRDVADYENVATENTDLSLEMPLAEIMPVLPEAVEELRRGLEWKDRYSLGIDFLDEQHKLIFHMLTRLIHCTEGQEENQSREDLFEQLIYFMNRHFSTEERWMKQCRHGEYHKHKRLHGLIMEEMRRRMFAHQSLFKELDAGDVYRLMASWTVHVEQNDRTYVPDLIEQAGEMVISEDQDEWQWPEEGPNQLVCLVVEDHPFQRELLVRVLRQLNVGKIMAAADGEEALQVLRQAAIEKTMPDVILCDLYMPNVDGIELLRHLHQTRVQSGLILISGVDSRILHTAAEIAKEHGLRFLGHVEKPVGAEQLSGLLWQMVKHKRVHRLPRDYHQLLVSRQEAERAIQEKLFIPLFQPKVSVDTGKVCGVEMLARWKHPGHGLLRPRQFLPLLEESGLLAAFDRLMLETGMEMLAAWQKDGWKVPLAMNFSLVGEEKLELPEFIHQIAYGKGIRPSQITLEISGNREGKMDADDLDVLIRLRMKGFELAMDDFSLANGAVGHLLRVPFTELKLDRSYLQMIEISRETQNVAESLIQMARSIGLRVVAEGVETKKEFALIRKLQCEQVQGYYIAHPMPLEALLTWLSR